MSAIGFQLPEDVVAVRDGVMRFVEAEVLPRLERNHALFNDPRLTYAADGRYAPEVRALCEQYGLAYNSRPFIRQFGSVLWKLLRLTFPSGKRPRRRAVAAG